MEVSATFSSTIWIPKNKTNTKASFLSLHQIIRKSFSDQRINSKKTFFVQITCLSDQQHKFQKISIYNT